MSTQAQTRLSISPGQGLLFLIERYRDEVQELDASSVRDASYHEKLKKLKDKLEKLYFLYLSGAKNVESREEIEKFLENKALSGYGISYDYETIDEDRSRRYFETYLAFETLKHTLPRLNKQNLESYCNILYDLIPASPKEELSKVFMGRPVSNKEIFNSEGIKVLSEYGNVFRRLRSTPLYLALSALDREKIELLIKCSLLSIMSMGIYKFPIDIYGKGIFSEKNRGKRLKNEQETVSSYNLGIMKSYMPVPQDNIAYAATEASYLRAADQATFNKNSKWARSNFNALVHPFSNSISGTVLCQMRIIKHFLKSPQFKFNHLEDFTNFMKCFISTMLYYTGGHSIHEYTAVLTLPEVQKAFSSIKGFENISEEMLFLRDNGEAFNAALDSTLSYNNSLLKRERLINSLPSNENSDLIKNHYRLKEEIEQKSNGHVYASLSRYFDEKSKEIETVAKENNLSLLETSSLKNALLEQLRTVNFNRAYIEKKFEYEGIANLEINYKSFLRYIHSAEIAPELADIEKFVRDKMELETVKNDFSLKVENLKKIINNYKKYNKQYIVTAFNEEVKKFEVYIKNNPKINISFFKYKITLLLEKIQERENKYYTNLFFSNFRKTHSSLQVKINDAVKMIDQLDTKEKLHP